MFRNDDEIKEFINYLKKFNFGIKELTVTEEVFNSLVWYLSKFNSTKEIYDSGKLEGSICGVIIRGVK